MCKYGGSGSVNTAVHHYYNTGYRSDYLDTLNPALGISQASVVVNGANLVCSFTLDNTNSNPKYFNLNGAISPYIIAAYGVLQGTGCKILLITSAKKIEILETP